MFDESFAGRVRALAQAFEAAGLTRLTVKDGPFEVEMRRAAALRFAAPAGAIRLDEAAAPKPEVVSSDVVGVVRFLRPQVDEGQRFDGDRDLAFIEALGIRNAVRSRGAGKVAAVFVTDGQPVEYGQPLFAIERV